MRTVPYTRSVTSARSRAERFELRRVRGRRMCAYAPSSIRKSASTAIRRDESTGASVTRGPRSQWEFAEWGVAEREVDSRKVDLYIAAQTGAPRARSHDALAFGLHVVEGEHPGRGAEETVGADDAHREWFARGHLGGGNFVRAPHLHAATAGPEPRARTRVAGPHDTGQIRRRAVGVEPELVDAELLGIRRLAAPAARASFRGSSAAGRRSSSVPASTRHFVQLPRRLARARSVRGRARTLVRCRGRLRSA